MTNTMQPKPKITCPACNLVLKLNTNGLIPRHKPRWREGPNSMKAPVCFASGKALSEVETLCFQFSESQ